MDEAPLKLLTVNTAPDRAKTLISRVIEALKPEYNLQHVDNCQNIDEVTAKTTQYRPGVLISASMWSDREAEHIHTLARDVVPDLITHAIPTGLQVERGPDAIVEYLVTKLPVILSEKL